MLITSVIIISLIASCYCIYSKTFYTNMLTKSLIIISLIASCYCIYSKTFYTNILTTSILSARVIVILPNTGHENNITKQLNLQQIRILHLMFHRLTVKALFCSLKGGITRKFRMLCFVIINLCFVIINLCFVLINSVLFNLFMCLDLVLER